MKFEIARIITGLRFEMRPPHQHRYVFERGFYRHQTRRTKKWYEVCPAARVWSRRFEIKRFTRIFAKRPAFGGAEIRVLEPYDFSSKSISSTRIYCDFATSVLADDHSSCMQKTLVRRSSA